MTTEEILETVLTSDWPGEPQQKKEFIFLLHELEYFGRKIFNHFKISEEDLPLILKLMAYFYNDRELCKKLDVDLSKGIMLTGPVGCGKTTLIIVINQLLPSSIKYGIKVCRELTFDLEEYGSKVIMDYSKKIRPSDNTLMPYCFDDLGAEQIANRFGKEYNVMAEIIQFRYDYHCRLKLLTHFTTNLNAQEIEDTYGLRIRSRLNSMVNLISFDKTSADKRKLKIKD